MGPSPAHKGDKETTDTADEFAFLVKRKLLCVLYTQETFPFLCVKQQNGKGGRIMSAQPGQI